MSEFLFAALLSIFVAVGIGCVTEIASLRERVAALEAEVREVDKQ